MMNNNNNNKTTNRVGKQTRSKKQAGKSMLLLARTRMSFLSNDDCKSLRSLCCIMIVLTIWASNASHAQGYSNYDPEQQDGIPVLSARSLNPRPADDWLNGDDEQLRREQRLARAQRRNSDADLDDGIEDDDDDEYQSGSNKHESIEPTFGESRRAAKDGDEIEHFFDKHLGPPEEAGSSQQASHEAPIQTAPVAPDMDQDEEDVYEAAASSPLSSIFQSLLGAHRKPFVIHATSDDSQPDSSSSSDSASKDAQVGSGSAPKGSASQPSGLADHYVQSVAPIAFLAPIAAPSSIDSYETQANEQADDQAPGQPQAGGVREIYIGRRPAVAKFIQQSGQPAPSHQAIGGYGGGDDGALMGGASGQVWRNAPMLYPGASGRLYGQQATGYDASQATDYSRYPVAASYAYQREQSQAAPAADDGQTVTYGLSFGASPADEPGDEASPVDTGTQEDSTSAYEEHQQPQPQTAGYVPYNARELQRYKTASTSAHNNYQNGGPPGYMSIPQHQLAAAAAYLYQQQLRQYQQQQQHQQQHQHQQQQSPYHGSRYHRDPAEAQTDYVAVDEKGARHGRKLYVRPRASKLRLTQNEQSNTAQSIERQQLLADLNKQIQASPYYNRPHELNRRPDKQITSSSQTINDGVLSTDVDTYDSYHSEMDPYKTHTTRSKMIHYPGQARHNDNYQHNSPVESGSNRMSANADGNDPSRSQQNDYNQSGKVPTTANQSQHYPDGHRENLGSTNDVVANANIEQQQPQNNGLLTGPLITNFDSMKTSTSKDGLDLMRNNPDNSNDRTTNDPNSVHANLRVRRDDSDDREGEVDDDDDGVWVDDDEDDNKQQSSDVNETSHEPEEDQSHEQDATDGGNNQMVPISPPGVIGSPHGYELSPNDLMIYHG